MSSTIVFRLERIASRSVGAFQVIRLQGCRQIIQVPTSRFFSSDNNDDKSPQPTNWRKQQLDKLEKKFQDGGDGADIASKIQDDEDLQPMWQSMESRVKNRKPRTLEENKGKIGRANIRKTEEDIWLQEGLYEDDENDKIPSK